ncbi:right-handed parallel beta-helix repeat-containing protein [uncultured Azohydromonas sp.]|uniref:right-handed parallel beta-helix repeat-containing protein n=1 Tax=uncultured Azohydromonas sp. TaxID=487342 RepID=UPI00261E3C32|nr:right-handed parallel beta-helix repeat-containing protein [uncultured Azohydromonas sp.]
MLIAIQTTANAQPQDLFNTWTGIAAEKNTSPATAQAGDLTREWKAPDGRTVRVVVQRPRESAAALTVVVSPLAADQDARPVFEAALRQVRASRASKLVILPGRYVFRTTAQSGPPAVLAAHLLLQDLDDVSIEGEGATLVFMQDAHGLLVRGSRRLQLSKLRLDYGLRTASLGTVQRQGGNTRVRIDPKFPVTSADPAFYVTEYDAAAKRYPTDAARVILPPGSSTPAVYAGNQSYGSTAFATLPEGRGVTVKHQWYGGNAIRIDDTPQPRQSEDIVIDGVTIHAAPGMGIVAYGLKRGLAITRSRFAPRDGSQPLSASYDAIHVVMSGGDTLITNNHITAQGDDAINLNGPVHPITRVEDGRRSVVLGKYSRFIGAGDRLAFFDAQGQYLGQRKVAATPAPLGGLDHRVTLDQPLDAGWAVNVVRDLSLLGSRYAVADNVIERCYCHGLLAQLPNGLVEGNTFQDIGRNAIRLLTDVGQWNEGVGAINVIVRGNRIRRTGGDPAGLLPWAAISVYGGARDGTLSTAPVNRHVRIANNTIENVPLGCVTVSNSVDVSVRDNQCTDTNLLDPRGASLLVMPTAAEVQLGNNLRSGATTGAQLVSTPASSALKPR